MKVELLVRLSGQNKVRLVWDKLSIAKDKAINNDFVVMEQVPELHCGSDKFENLVIEGENYDALRWLRMTHKGKVQCIYIDPPYNTGAATFCYADQFEASQWLSFLETRLKIAKDLLSEDGAILVSIDDANRDCLKLLMDEVFAGMFVGSFVTKTRIQSNYSADHHFSSDHDHVLIYANENFAFGGDKKSFEMYSNPDNDPRGDWRSNTLTCTYDYLSPSCGTLFYPLEDPSTGIVYACDPDHVWRYASEKYMKPGTKVKAASMEEFIRRGQIIFPKNPKIPYVVYPTMSALLEAIDAGQVPSSGKAPLLRRELPEWYLKEFVGRKVGYGKPSFKCFKKDLKHDRQPVSSWIRPTPHKEDADLSRCEMVASYNQEGTKVLRDIFGGKVFDYPKPLTLLKELIRQATKPDSIVLDFFAGSGTTAHAVLAVNKDDEGNRRFIMVSEANGKDPDNTLPYGKNLCKQVLAERIRRVIPCTGGNFAYLRTKLVPQMAVPFHLMSDAELWTLLQVAHGLPLKSGFEGPVEANSHANVSVIFSPLGRRVDVARVAEVLEKAEGAIFLYTWEEAAFKKFERRVSLRVLPDFLLNFGD